MELASNTGLLGGVDFAVETETDDRAMSERWNRHVAHFVYRVASRMSSGAF